MTKTSLDSFSPSARQALELAYAAAAERGEPQVTPEDLWLGILDVGDPVGRALLGCLGVSAEQLRALAHQDRQPVDAAKAAVTLACYETFQAEHWYVGTEHLILGLLHEGGRIPTELDRQGFSYVAARWWAAVIWRQHRLPAGAFNATRLERIGDVVRKRWSPTATLLVIAAAIASLFMFLPRASQPCGDARFTALLTFAIGGAAGLLVDLIEIADPTKREGAMRLMLYPIGVGGFLAIVIALFTRANLGCW